MVILAVLPPIELYHTHKIYTLTQYSNHPAHRPARTTEEGEVMVTAINAEAGGASVSARVCPPWW